MSSKSTYAAFASSCSVCFFLALYSYIFLFCSSSSNSLFFLISLSLAFLICSSFCFNCISSCFLLTTVVSCSFCFSKYLYRFASMSLYRLTSSSSLRRCSSYMATSLWRRSSRYLSSLSSCLSRSLALISSLLRYSWSDCSSKVRETLPVRVSKLLCLPLILT
jgi:hypothetical protein